MLGLDLGAGEREIKRAFRRLAMRWHPDRNPDPAAAEQFRRLRAAYESLLEELEAAGRSGPQRGDEGNAPGESGPDNGARNGAADGDAPDGEASGEASRDGDAARDDAPGSGSRPRGPDRRQDITLSIEEAFLGCDKHVAIERETSCDACDGTGTEVLRHTRLCAACHGSGRLREGRRLVPCETCGGRGFLTRQECGACGGSGRRRRQRTVSVKVPAGILRGDELRLAGEGEPSDDPDGEPGDLRLRVAIAPHPLYTLSGRDLILSRPVSALRLLAGGELPVPVPGGVRRLRLDPGKAEAREIRVAGAGFPARRGQAAGDLVVQLEPVFPENPDAAARRLIARLEAELARAPGRHWPGLAEWEARWLDGGENGE